MTSFLQRIDVLADDEAPIHRINIEGNTIYKSALGGFCSLNLVIVFLIILYLESGDVINKRYPFVQTKNVKSPADISVYLKDLPVLWFDIRDAGEYYELDRSKIDLYA